MELAVLGGLGAVVLLVAIDAIGRFDERRVRSQPPKHDSKKIVIDLSKRD
jgi:hypothetical protein